MSVAVIPIPQLSGAFDQDSYWERPILVKVAGAKRESQEEPECTNHKAFAKAIRDASCSHDVVIAEGFQLLHSPEVYSQLTLCYSLELSWEEARRRRTQGCGRLNPNPLSSSDFDDLAWPAHERYVAQSVFPLVKEGKVVELPSPSSEEDVTLIATRILAATGVPKLSAELYRHGQDAGVTGADGDRR